MSLHQHLKALLYADSGAAAFDAPAPVAPADPQPLLTPEQMAGMDDCAGIES